MKLKKLMEYINYKTKVKVVGQWFDEQRGVKDTDHWLFFDSPKLFFDSGSVCGAYKRIADLKVQGIYLDDSGNFIIVEVST